MVYVKSFEISKRIFAYLTLLLLIAAVSSAASPGNVIINELMWMGSDASTADEWIELRNTTGSAIDLSGWQLTKNGNGEELMLEIPAGKTIEASGYFLISNNPSDNSNIADAITPDVVDASVSLSNSKLQIKLYDGQWDAEATLIDTADDGVGTPAAGIKDPPKKSMVRKADPGDGTDPANWYTADTRWGWDASAEEWGTPGVDNTLPVELSSVTARLTLDGVVLKWRTESEIENAGFNLYRGEDGEFVKINASLIVGAGTTAIPQEYRYVDEAIEDASKVVYIVESVAFDGETSRSESIEVVPLLKSKKKIIVLWGRLKAVD